MTSEYFRSIMVLPLLSLRTQTSSLQRRLTSSRWNFLSSRVVNTNQFVHASFDIIPDGSLLPYQLETTSFQQPDKLTELHHYVNTLLFN
jgi:hypothetical protein